MRKETIIKYEKEFLAWCKNKSVLLGVPASMHDKTLIWREVRDFNDWKSLDAVYVLNDSYSYYRKALAEGKTIQMYCKYDGVTPIWDDMTEVIKSIGFVMTKDNYRIKPEEPKFKVGDWVVHNGVIKQVTKAVDGLIDSLDNQVAVIMKDESLELWEPKEGEWCIMYDIDEDPDADSVTLQKWDGKRKWKPIPFIGKLPPYIKK